MAAIFTTDDIMLADMRGAIELSSLPGGSEELQRQLIGVEQADASDVAALKRLISLAHAAQAVADAGIDETFTSWYRDMAQRLLRRAMDAVVVIEAMEASRQAGGLN